MCHFQDNSNYSNYQAYLLILIEDVGPTFNTALEGAELKIFPGLPACVMQCL